MVFPRSDTTYSHLKSEFQPTNDGSFAWESAVSAYQYLPALRGFWPMSANSPTGDARDLGGGGFHLTDANIPVFGDYNSIPACYIQRANSERLYHADNANFDIIGTESSTRATNRGLTLGAWVRFTVLSPGNQEVIMSKWNTANQKAYMLFKSSSNESLYFYITTDGSTNFGVNTGITPATGKWYFLVGRFDPSTEVRMWINDTSYINNVSVPATIHNSTEEFCIGANNGGANYSSIQVSLAFICAAELPTRTIRRLYYRTRSLFQSRQDW